MTTESLQVGFPSWAHFVACVGMLGEVGEDWLQWGRRGAELGVTTEPGSGTPGFGGFGESGLFWGVLGGSYGLQLLVTYSFIHSLIHSIESD